MSASSVSNLDGTPFETSRRREVSNVIPLLSPKGCREARRQLRWSQQFLASEAGLSIATIVNFELGLHRLRPRNVALISAVFEAVGCSVLGDRVFLRPLRQAAE
jgi:DNA-binding XRE family transcriptional regulator